MKKSSTLLLLFAGSINLLVGRSIHRPEYQCIPEIITRWEDQGKTYHLKSWYLSERPIFHLYKKEYFERHTLPEGEITFRNNPQKSVSGKKLSEMIDEVVEQIKKRKTKYEHFKILKQEDFNWHEPAGLIVLKFKDYPFVVKLFLETPKSFVQPYSKGWRPAFFFVMGKGVNRYLQGFTRIPNLENIRKKLDESPYWREQTDLPRKWFYLPQDTRDFEIWGKNFHSYKTPYIKLPSVYAIIADQINGKPLKILKRKDRKFGIKLAQYLCNSLDAHIDNFIVEKETGKVVIIDTEHFITVTGISPNMRYSRYTKWYLKIAGKALKDLFFRGKQSRRYGPPYREEHEEKPDMEPLSDDEAPSA